MKKTPFRATGEAVPSIPELIATAAGIVLTGRQVIVAADRTKPDDVAETLDALHEHLAVAGGSLLFLAEALDCKTEVDRLLKEGQARINAFLLSAGQEGRA